MTSAPVLRALTDLLDATIEEILDAARPRTFDRLAIVTAAGMWDHGLPELLAAVTAPTSSDQEKLALAALRWMGTVRPGREDWFRRMGMRDDIVTYLPPPRAGGPYRDYAGRVRPWPQALTAPAWADLDYDLSAATIEHVRLDHSRKGCNAVVGLHAPRLFPTSAGAPTPRVSLWLDDTKVLTFDSADRTGVRATFTGDGLIVTLRRDGRLVSRSGEVSIEDSFWHESAAGRAADAVVPPRDAARSRQERDVPTLSADARAVASVLRWAFLEIRAVRYPTAARSGVVTGLAEMIRGCGAALFAVSTIEGTETRNDQLRDFITQLAARSPGASRWIRQQLDSTQTGRPDLAAQIVELPTAPHPKPALQYERAEVRHLSWTSSRWPHGNRPDELQAVLAVPDQHDSWRTVPVVHTDPDRVRLTATSYEVDGASHHSTP